MDTLTLTAVESPAEMQSFLDLPWGIYQDDPHWIPPLQKELKRLLDPSVHPFWQLAIQHTPSASPLPHTLAIPQRGMYWPWLWTPTRWLFRSSYRIPLCGLARALREGMSAGGGQGCVLPCYRPLPFDSSLSAHSRIVSSTLPIWNLTSRSSKRRNRTPSFSNESVLSRRSWRARPFSFGLYWTNCFFTFGYTHPF